MSTSLLSRNLKSWKSAGAAMAVGVVLAVSLASSQAWALKLGKNPPPVKVAPGSPALALQNAFVEVVSAVGPAVVNIKADWTENVYNPFGDMNDWMDYFFN